MEEVIINGVKYVPEVKSSTIKYFHDLAIGDCFKYYGELYIRTPPTKNEFGVDINSVNIVGKQVGRFFKFNNQEVLPYKLEI